MIDLAPYHVAGVVQAVAELVQDHAAYTHAVSIFDANDDRDRREFVRMWMNDWKRNPTKLLSLRFDDITRHRKGYVVPNVGHIQQIVSFAVPALKNKDNRVLFHCAQGIRRSSAAAWMSVKLASEETASFALAHVREHAANGSNICPNSLMCEIADSIYKTGLVLAGTSTFGSRWL